VAIPAACRTCRDRLNSPKTDKVDARCPACNVEWRLTLMDPVGYWSGAGITIALSVG
jgi:hypothetical protein